MAPGRDRLSGLNDDVLRRILYFAPAREGASTCALSKRWTTSPLWRSSGALNLEIRLPAEYANRRFYDRRDGIVSRAHETLDAVDEAGVPLTGLTFRVEDHNRGKIERFLHRDVKYDKKHDVVDDLISHRAVRRVEDLRIAAVDGQALRLLRRVYDRYSSTHAPGIYRLRLGSLPSETLRVLDLAGCSGLELPLPSAVTFPQLVSLRLSDCSVHFQVLQGLIDIAPALAVIHLESVQLKRKYMRRAPQEGLLCRLSCPAAAVLMLDRCGWKKEVCIEIDAPRLKRFRYTGLLRQILLTPPSPDLKRADITILGYKGNRKDPSDVHRNFWRFVQNYTHAKEMRLIVPNLEDIAILNEARRVQLLPEFRNMERLEVEGVHRPTGKTAAVAIANLLRCCPALRDLRIKLNKMEGCRHRPDFLEKKYSSDLQDSINRFKRHRWDHPTMPATGDEDEHGEYHDVPDILALSGRSFECLRSSLTRVGLQFRQAKTDCFGVKLIKFFAENSTVLEEMCIDSGTEKLCDHLNPKVRAWIRNSSKRRKMDPTDTARNILVSPLERRN